MRWNKGAKDSIVTAGGHGIGDALTQLNHPNGLFVDTLNNRVMRWHQEAGHGTMIVGGNDSGTGANQFNLLDNLSFDRYGNLYVVDRNNHRVQRFSIE
ncbi:unnamed protein product [Rotaria socialis]|uniref:Uncharacterized protein n=1 Tax=Rotaria socialis TaxID=392032 RepID=A0A820FT80_9BILA|nr:unnamed protein product [Rotaria socialis]CAF3311954.1 unnamed protein product [Rotaria socialis]CAF3399491.1 unnamed protein product [Rotaria socialis]CAF4268911.1 unnamed protein product [Rotaria socialis]CAF4406919.1 unnamed protein product [Rotaria socialis]